MTEQMDVIERLIGMAVNRECRQCRGTGVATVKHGTTFCTDSDDEIRDAYHREACPTCAKERIHARDALASLRTEVAAQQAEIERLEKANSGLRNAITMGSQDNHRRNVELDALHYVWCSGGCESGSHRFGEHPPLTQEIVQAAIDNTRRLVRHFENKEHRKLSNAEVKSQWEEKCSMKSTIEAQQAEIAALRGLIEKAGTAIDGVCSEIQAHHVADITIEAQARLLHARDAVHAKLAAVGSAGEQEAKWNPTTSITGDLVE